MRYSLLEKFLSGFPFEASALLIAKQVVWMEIEAQGYRDLQYDDLKIESIVYGKCSKDYQTVTLFVGRSEVRAKMTCMCSISTTTHPTKEILTGLVTTIHQPGGRWMHDEPISSTLHIDEHGGFVFNKDKGEKGAERKIFGFYIKDPIVRPTKPWDEMRKRSYWIK